ncbi:hypothetical protein D0Z07_2130 [Hyphodiscus hymeniophilus]|uniref:Uncharacterized protein n=1 Tax=Hyphodiscus hymeniophilus TaxID=353542 RepID=A0A9P7AZM4_9HELO|nr:hypothetical protein D0Z07_2130 [Hyphodiscus hymeniophilus]
MFRFFKPRKAVLTTARLPMRLETMRQNGQLHNVQRVQFQKRGIRWRPILITGGALYITTQIYDRLVLEPLAKTLDDAGDLDLPDTSDEEEVEEGGIFIPFPLTTKELEPRPYRGSDPEWQEFIKFSKDQELAKRVRDDLANFVRTAAEKHPLLTVRCGKGMKLRRYWLDVDFPTHPPPEFERTGIEITDDFVAISTMPVEPLTVSRIRNILWPSPVMKSSWSFIKVLVAEDIRSIAKVLGLQTGSPTTTIEQVLAKHAELTRLPPPPPKKDSKDGPSPLPPLTQTPGRATIPTRPEIKTTGEEKTAVQQGPLQGHLAKPILAFKTEFQKNFKPAKNYPPRGSILVTGLVEVDSPRAWLVFDVRAAWDPSTKTYDPLSMVLSLRRLQMKKQGPVGGS